MRFISALIVLLISTSMSYSQVAPLVTTEWQTFNLPYHALYPYNGSEQVGNACGPTALAHIINYWQFPLHGNGNINFTDNFGINWQADLTNAHYEYLRMYDYLSAGSTEDEYFHTAQLFLHVTASLEDYWDSGRSLQELAEILSEKFYYNDDFEILYLADYDLADIENIIKNELDNGRPIVVEGWGPDSSPPGEPGGHSGHYFVLDGYNENNEFHIHWNVDNDEGYYKLNELRDPPNDIDYSAYVWFLTNFHPDTEGKTLEATGPDTPELLQAGSQYNITWNAENINNIDIYYTTDDARTWQLAAANQTAAAGNYTWTLPNEVYDAIRIRLIDTENGNIYANSVSTISTYAQQSLSLQYPIGGEYYQAGTELPIMFNSTGIQNFTFEYSPDNGATWNVIEENVHITNGKYNWTLPDIISAQVLVRVKNAADGALVSASAQPFTVNVFNPLCGAYGNDDNTVLLLHLDGDVENSSSAGYGITSTANDYEMNSVPGLGKNMVFNNVGNDKKITVNHDNELNLTGNWTIETWFYIESWDNPANSWPLLFIKPTEGWKSTYYAEVASTDGFMRIGFYSRGEDYSIQTSNNLIKTGRWYHLAFIRNSAESYIQVKVHDANRSEIYSRTQTYPSGAVPEVANNDLLIGSGLFSENHLDGKMDEFRISNTIRSFEDPGSFSHPPVVTSLPSITINEDESGTVNTADLMQYINDDDTPLNQLTLSIQGSQHISAAAEGNVYTLTPAKNWFGTDSTMLSVNDAVNTVYKKFAVIVQPVNDAPEFTELPDSIKFMANDTYTFNIWDCVSDVESEDAALQISISVDAANLNYDYDEYNGDVTLSLNQEVSATYLLTIQVDDGSGGLAAQSITIVTDMVTGIDKEKGIPTEYTLKQNYPNPFNPSTVIEYSIPFASQVKLTIYDVAGRKVAELVNGNLSAGYHSTTWNGGSVSSGIYFYTLKAYPNSGAQSYTQTSKMILMK